MRAELLLRLAARPESFLELKDDELCELLREADPLPGTFEAVKRRRLSDSLIHVLLQHPKTPQEILLGLVRQRHGLYAFYHYHSSVHSGVLSAAEALRGVVPEPVELPLLDSRLLAYLGRHLPDETKHCLAWQDSSHERTPPRPYNPLSSVMLLGDFLFYLTTRMHFEEPLPVTARIALALNPTQRMEAFHNDADVRVRFALKESLAWRN